VDSEGLVALNTPPRDVPLGLYLHIPFCRKRCHFCYFRVYTNKSAREVEQYLDLVAREWELYARTPALAGRPLSFVYFGGGTPSFLSTTQLQGLVSRLSATKSWDGAEEITFECEPGTLSKPKLETLRELGVTRIVTTDPHAFNALRNEFPELGVTFEVVHHTQLLATLIAEGRLPLDASVERVVFHDPCYLGRHNGEYDAPRAVLARVASDGVRECDLSRDKAMCCGAGGGRMWMEETIGTRINIARVQQALAQSPAVIATACPYCAVMVSDGLKALGRYDDVKALDVVEIVATSLPSVVPDLASAA
jgi:hypothetical protein